MDPATSAGWQFKVLTISKWTLQQVRGDNLRCLPSVCHLATSAGWQFKVLTISKWTPQQVRGDNLRCLPSVCHPALVAGSISNWVTHKTNVRKIQNYQIRSAIWLQAKAFFGDGISGIVDPSHLKGEGVFKIWDDYEEFNPDPSLESRHYLY